MCASKVSLCSPVVHITCNFWFVCLCAVLQYMQFVEDYSEPQPSVFYQTPQSERIYEQRRNKRFQEVYGSNDSYETSPPPALPPKQRQLVCIFTHIPRRYNDSKHETIKSADSDVSTMFYKHAHLLHTALHSEALKNSIWLVHMLKGQRSGCCMKE